MANGALGRVAQKQARPHATADGGNEVKKITRAKREPEDSRWNFSFRYWSQRDYFGLDGKSIDNQWLVSVLERLKILSAEPIERVYRDGAMRDAMRFHPINWKATNIPIAKTDLDGLPEHCYDNPEFELHQFQISKGRGRVVGFFDEHWVFNIVLLDPLHNLQPSKSFNYAVDPCHPLSCELTSLREGIKEHIGQCQEAGCKAAHEVSRLAHGHERHVEQFEILMIKVKDQGQMEWAKNLVAQGKVQSIADIFELGLITLDDQKTPQ